jgi:crossover junction endodeoxyribonuclease RusA
VSEGDWVGSGTTKGRAIAGGYEFQLSEVTSQSRVYKQKLRDLLRLEMALIPQDGEYEVAITIELNPNFPAIDLDNVAKAILDGIKGFVFYDDAQVMKLVVEKRWAEGERVMVEVKKRGEQH